MNKISLEKNKNIKKQELKIKGITLISLVIIIVILIILAGVVINLSLRQNGIFSRAKQAKEEYINSMKEEQQQLNDAYGQILVATGENATITMTMKQLDDLINERINSKLYIDTSKKITELTVNKEYEATEDCVIVGILNGHSVSGITVNIDGVDIGGFGNNTDRGVTIPIYYNLKAGQKIIFKPQGTNYVFAASAYSTLKK